MNGFGSITPAIILKRAETGGAEMWLKRVNEIIRAYRGTTMTVPHAGTTVTVDVPRISLNDAVAELRKLHLTEGDAMRYLRGKQK